MVSDDPGVTDSCPANARWVWGRTGGGQGINSMPPPNSGDRGREGGGIEEGNCFELCMQEAKKQLMALSLITTAALYHVCSLLGQMQIYTDNVKIFEYKLKSDGLQMGSEQISCDL